MTRICRFACLIGLLYFAAMIPPCLLADDASDKRKQDILDFEKRWKLALDAGDAAKIDAMVAKEFVIIGPAGNIVDRPTYLKGVANGREGQVVRPKIYDVKFIKDDVAVVHGETHVKGPRNGKEIEFTLIWTDLMIHRDGRWQCAWCHCSALNAKWDEPFFLPQKK